MSDLDEVKDVKGCESRGVRGKLERCFVIPPLSIDRERARRG